MGCGSPHIQDATYSKVAGWVYTSVARAADISRTTVGVFIKGQRLKQRDGPVTGPHPTRPDPTRANQKRSVSPFRGRSVIELPSATPICQIQHGYGQEATLSDSQ